MIKGGGDGVVADGAFGANGARTPGDADGLGESQLKRIDTTSAAGTVNNLKTSFFLSMYHPCRENPC